MKTKTIGFIGGGRVTKIMLQAFKNKNFDLSSIMVTDTSREVLAQLKNEMPPINAKEKVDQVASQDIVFIALHPPEILKILDNLKTSFSHEMIGVSLAPKITLKQLTHITGRKKWARMIPNATSYVNQGCNPFVLSPAINYHEEKRLHKIFHLLGNSFKVKEDLLEAYAIVTAMSPTYFWYQWQYLAELGELFGLDEKACKMALYETISSSADLLFNSNLTYEEVKDLIPVKPLSEIEGFVKSTMKEKLSEVYEKIKPQNLVAN